MTTAPADDRDALLAFLAARHLLLPPDWNDETSLIRSGILDSVNLFEMILWLEQRLGRQIDPTDLVLEDEFDSVRSTLRFLAAQRAS